MRRNNGTLNGQLARILSETGHTDRLLVCDAGLPIPLALERVDLAVRANLPRFLDLLDVVLAEVAVEDAVLAEEIRQHSPDMLAEVERRLAALGLKPRFVPHVRFKEDMRGARAAVRSGEFTPYSNILLTAGVVY